jgi:hypothetical protein
VKLLLTLCVVGLVSQFSCAHVPAPVSTFGECSLANLEAAAPGLISEVTTDVATSDYAALLGQLVTQVGLPEVQCAVDLLIASLSSRHAAAHDAVLLNTSLERARAWRLAHQS